MVYMKLQQNVGAREIQLLLLASALFVTFSALPRASLEAMFFVRCSHTLCALLCALQNCLVWRGQHVPLEVCS